MYIAEPHADAHTVPEAQTPNGDADAACSASGVNGSAGELAAGTNTGTEATGTTVWRRDLRTPLRQFLHNETGSAAILAFATIAALIWANISFAAYGYFWSMPLNASIAGATLSISLRTFVNSGLMAFFLAGRFM